MEGKNKEVKIYYEKSEVNNPEVVDVHLVLVFRLDGTRLKVLENSTTS